VHRGVVFTAFALALAVLLSTTRGAEAPTWQLVQLADGSFAEVVNGVEQRLVLERMSQAELGDLPLGNPVDLGASDFRDQAPGR